MWVIAVVALAVLWKWKVNPGWVVLGRGLAGMLLTAAR
jgi:chromate transport protein ChrA